MAMSAFGVEHLEPIGKRDNSAALGAGAAGAATGAVVAHKSQGDFRKLALSRRGKGILQGVIESDPNKVARHVRGAVGDAKKFAALGYAKHGLGAAAVGLAGAAALSAESRRKS